jgi:hypothetical protein
MTAYLRQRSLPPHGPPACGQPEAAGPRAHRHDQVDAGDRFNPATTVRTVQSVPESAGRDRAPEQGQAMRVFHRGGALPMEEGDE